MLKAHLWHSWGPTQPEEPRGRSMGTKTSRMPTQAEFHAQTQATYEHFGHFHNRQQESHEEALKVARDAHCQVPMAAALLEGHIERLSCSISLGSLAAMGNQVVTGVHTVEDI